LISPIVYYLFPEVVNFIKAISVVSTIRTKVVMSIILILYIVWEHCFGSQWGNHNFVHTQEQYRGLWEYREVVAGPSLEVFKSRLDGALSSLV